MKMSKDVIDEIMQDGKKKLANMTALELLDRMNKLHEKIIDDVSNSDIPVILCLAVLNETADDLRAAIREIGEE